jgi:hypothetical protein
MKPKLILCLALVLSGHCHAAIIFPEQAKIDSNVVNREVIAYCRASLSPLRNDKRIDKLNVMMGHRCYWPDYRLGSAEKLLSITVNGPGFEYMLVSGTNMLGTIGLMQDRSNHWAVGGLVLRDDQPEPMWVGLAKAKELPQVKSKDYEFRFLCLEGADYPMIWLHCDSDDILIPLSDGYRKWKAYKPYSESEMIKLWRPVVENMSKVGGVLQ